MATTHTGNTWPDNPYDQFGAFIFADNIGNTLPSAFFSRFIVDSGENLDFLPYPIGPDEVDNGNWFKDMTAIHGTNTCLTDIGLPLIEPDTLQKLARTSLDFDEYNDQMTWFLKADIFETMLNYPALHSNTILDSLYDAEENSALGKLVTWQYLLTSKFGVQRSEKNLCQDTMNYLSADVVYIDSILALSPSDSASWLALRALKGDSLSEKLVQWSGFLDDEYSESMDAYSDIQDDLKSLTTTNDLEDYLDQALIFKTQYLLGTGFTNADSSDIADLASLCPWLGGRAISVAEEIYSTINNNISIPTLNNCPSPSPFIVYRPTSTADNNMGLVIYPNPASVIVTVKSPNVMNEIYLTDLNLRQIYSFSPNDKVFTFNSSQLTSGMYLLCVRTEKNTQIQSFTVSNIK